MKEQGSDLLFLESLGVKINDTTNYYLTWPNLTWPLCSTVVTPRCIHHLLKILMRNSESQIENLGGGEIYSEVYDCHPLLNVFFMVLFPL